MFLNQGCEYRERLGAGADAKTLLAYLSQRYRHSSEAQWAERISSGQVQVNSQAAQADTVLHKGETLTWQRPPWHEPAAPLDFKVLHEDGDVLAVAKPAGLPTLPGANYLQATLLYQVQQSFPDATPLHRLGRWTSGIVLCARHPPARTALMQQWASRQVDKRYRALAGGNPAWSERTIIEPIGPVPHPLLGSVHAASTHGKPAQSQVIVRQRRADGFLCDVWIATGRAHQIRIHLAAAGHPLVGDPLYGAGGLPVADSRAVPGDPGYLLHAAELRFRHPRTAAEMLVECEPPPLLRLQESP
jgi:23S rRNA pseudouridine1911/1915/1917 synthase